MTAASKGEKNKTYSYEISKDQLLKAGSQKFLSFTTP